MLYSILGVLIAIGLVVGFIATFPVVGYIIAAVLIAIVSFFIYKKNKKKNKKSETSERDKYIQSRKDAHQDINQQTYKKGERILQEEKESREIEIQQQLENRKIFISERQELFANALSQIEPVPAIVSNRAAEKRNLSEMPETKFYKITRKTNVDSLFPLVFIDVETTGLNCRKNEIIEVSAIKYEADFTPDFCFTTLCKPKSDLPSEIVEITHITDEMLANAPSFAQIVDSLSEFVQGCNICGYNLEFDLKFLFVNGLDLPQKKKYIDVMDLVKSKLKRAPYNYYDNPNCTYDVVDYKLETVAERCNIYRNDAHRSLSDCFATANVLEALIEAFIK